MRSSRPALVKSQSSTEDPELAARFDRVLAETVEAMEEGRLNYAFIGGVASGGLGRPRSTHDIDLFVRPEDAELALRALAGRGFITEKTDAAWLYKGFKDGILVDVIFKSKGDIYLDPEMVQRLITAEYHGRRLRLVAPEDLLIIKAAAHSEQTPGHWHDAIALLSHAAMDWEYLLRRARRAPRRVLSLLLYAQSVDIGVPNHVVHSLYRSIFGDQSKGEYFSKPQEEHVVRTWPAPQAKSPRVPDPYEHDRLRVYGLGHLRERLAEDGRICELDLEIEQQGGRIVLKGEVASVDRRAVAEQIARELFPDADIDNQIRLLETREPAAPENLP